jgi:hypothetical protein
MLLEPSSGLVEQQQVFALRVAIGHHEAVVHFRWPWSRGDRPIHNLDQHLLAMMSSCFASRTFRWWRR